MKRKVTRTRKQNLASNRNWNKGCLKGMKSHLIRMQKVNSGLSEEEKTKIIAIQKDISSLLSAWS